MTETRFYEPARLSTPPKSLFSLKPLDTTTWLRSLLSKVFHPCLVPVRFFQGPLGQFTYVTNPRHGPREAKRNNEAQGLDRRRPKSFQMALDKSLSIGQEPMKSSLYLHWFLQSTHSRVACLRIPLDTLVFSDHLLLGSWPKQKLQPKNGARVKMRPCSVNIEKEAVAAGRCLKYSCFEKGSRKKCTRQSRKVLWVVLSALFSKEIWKNGTRGHRHMFASANGKQQK